MVLLQKVRAITNISKAMGPKYQLLSAYEKEFYVILFAMEKGQYYFLGHNFIIKNWPESLETFVGAISNNFNAKLGTKEINGFGF